MSQVTAYRSFFKSAAYIFALKLFPALANLAVFIVFSRLLGQEQYGHYQNLWIRLLVLAAVACAGFPAVLLTWPAAAIRHLYNSLSKRHLLFYVAWLFCLAAIFSLLESTHEKLAFIPCLVLFVFYVAGSIQEALLIAAKRFPLVSVVNFLYAAYFLGVHLLIVSEGYELSRLLGFILAGVVGRTIILSVITIAVYKPLAGVASEDISPAKARNLWLHLGFYDLTQIVFSWIDKFLVSLFLSAGLSAIYFNGSQNIPVLPLLLGAVGSAALIQLADKANVDKDHPVRLLYLSSRLLACVVFPLAFFLFFFRTELFSVILSDKYLPSVPVFAVALLVLPLRVYNFTSLLQHLHQGATINKGAILDLVIACSLAYPFYLIMGMPGVALAFVVSTYIQVSYYTHHILRQFGVSIGKLFPLKDLLFKFTGFLVLMGGLYYLLLGLTEPRMLLLLGFAGFSVISIAAFLLEMNRTKASHPGD